jgi:hypothetical protein
MATKTIGKRISIEEHSDAITIVIDQSIPFSQQLSLELWLGAWTGLGGLFGYGAWTYPGDERTFFLIGLIFWGFFMVRITKVALWRRMGREIIKISAGRLLIKNAFKTKGKDRYFALKKVGEFTAYDIPIKSFMQQLDQSFWIIGGDKIHFNFNGKSYVLGKQLKHSDALQLANVLNKSVSKYYIRLKRQRD